MCLERRKLKNIRGMLEIVWKCAEYRALEEQNSLEHASLWFNFQTTLCLENRLPETITQESRVPYLIKQRCSCHFKYPRAKALNKSMKPTSQRWKIQPQQ